jgi:hypothetical protein
MICAVDKLLISPETMATANAANAKHDANILLDDSFMRTQIILAYRRILNATRAQNLDYSTSSTMPSRIAMRVKSPGAGPF